MSITNWDFSLVLNFMSVQKKKDNNRIAFARRKSQNGTKKRRKTLRAVKKGYIDLDREKEGGKSYEAGGFSSK